MLRDPQAEPAQATATFTPATDILETAQGFELLLALPGVKKETVNIEFIDGQLVISGERNNPVTSTEEGAPKLRRGENAYGPFERSFRLPETVSVKNISAKLTDGVLHVTLPFDTEKVTKQHIEIR